MKTFYHHVLTHRGASNDKGTFAEAMFEDVGFPKTSHDFHELSDYIEMQAHEEMTTHVFDELWAEYAQKYGL